MIAAYRGHLPIVQYLSEVGTDPGVVDIVDKLLFSSQVHSMVQLLSCWRVLMVMLKLFNS
jgi:hypothetical protein